MTKAYSTLPLVASLLMLAGCSSSPSQPELNKLHNEVGKLNQEMRQLTQQASALEQQGLLNSGSHQGAWLVPLANSPVVLKSQAGDLSLSLSHVRSEANGTRATLNVRTTGNALLPAFSAEVESGELDRATGKPLSINSQKQRIELSGTLLPRHEASIPLRLNKVSPGQLDYVRIHDVAVSAGQPAPVAP